MATPDGTRFVTQPGVTPNAAPPRTTQRTGVVPGTRSVPQPLPFTSLDATIASAAPPNAAQTRVSLPYIPESAAAARRPASRQQSPAGLPSRVVMQMQAEQRAAFPTDNEKDLRIEHPLSLKDNPLDGPAAAPKPEENASAPTRVVMEQKANAAALPSDLAMIADDVLEGLVLRIEALELRVAELEEGSPAEESADELAAEEDATAVEDVEAAEEDAAAGDGEEAPEDIAEPEER